MRKMGLKFACIEAAVAWREIMGLRFKILKKVWSQNAWKKILQNANFLNFVLFVYFS